MKNLIYYMQNRNQVSFLLMLAFVVSSSFAMAQTPSQTPPPLFAGLMMMKVAPGKSGDFEKFMKETMLPVHNLRRQKGKIVHWIMFKVHFTGGNDAYNYVGVHYYPSWANTEANESLAALWKEANPKADLVAINAKFNELVTIVHQHLFYRAHAIEPKTPVPAKYVRLDYMKVKPGKDSDYLKAETEDWMPFHQTLVNEGQSTGWGLWQSVFPSGTDSPYDYVTSNRYNTYAQVMETDYEKTFQKASPSKKLDDIFNRTTQSRDLVKSELWEAVVMLE